MTKGKSASVRKSVQKSVKKRSTTNVSGRVARVAAAPAPILPKVERRKSPVHRFGVFALEPISKNKRIVPYVGEKITHAESAAREGRYLDKGRIWCFRLNRRWVIDAGVGGNVARFINHSCTPNCYSQIIGDTIWIRAGRNIEAGEELNYNYNTDGHGHIQCLCRPNCRNKL
jgi:SET domain-containing protein